MKITNETKVGIFTIFALTILVLGYAYMQGLQLFTATNQYYSVYEEVDGLKRSNPVLLRGYEVGKVTNIKMHPDNDDVKIIVEYTVNQDINVPVNSTARIINYDLLGAKAIELDLGSERQYAANRDTLRGEREMGLTESFNQLLAPVKQRTENLITSVDTVVTTLQKIIETAEIEYIFKSVQSAIASLERTSHRLDTVVSTEAGRLDRIFADIESITSNFQQQNAKMDNMMTNFSQVSDSLVAADIKRTLDKTYSSLNEIDSIAKRLSRGEGTAGKLLHDEELYDRLNQASYSLNRLTQNLIEEPHRYMNFNLFNLRRPNPPEPPKDRESSQ